MATAGCGLRIAGTDAKQPYVSKHFPSPLIPPTLSSHVFIINLVKISAKGVD